MKFCVIGLGRFGAQVATGLAENGMEVLAVDSNQAIVSSIRDQVTHAVALRITDEASLLSIGIEEIDTVIVAMGESFAQSILITALLKKRLQVPYVIARAMDDVHKEILKLVGADRVILPEKEIGIRIADNLSSPFMDLIRLTKEFSISQIVAPQEFIGKTVSDLNLFKRYKTRCIAKREDENVISIDPNYVIEEYDKIIFAGANTDLEKIAKLK